MLLVAFKRGLGEDGTTRSRYVVDDSASYNKIYKKGFADLAKLPSPELKSLSHLGS